MNRTQSKEMKQLIQGMDPLTRIALRLPPFRMIAWESIPLELQNLLLSRNKETDVDKKNGFNLQIYYPYVLPHEMAYQGMERRPDDVAHQVFMQRLAVLGLEAGFLKKNNLPLIERLRIGVQILGKKNDALAEIDRYFNEILDNNPNLKDGSLKSDMGKYEFLYRVLMGYSPTDIDFYVRKRQGVTEQWLLETEERNNQLLKDALEKLGIRNRRYLFSPKMAQQIAVKLNPGLAKTNMQQRERI